MNSVVLTDDGLVWAWGEPWGDFSLGISREPRRVEGVSDVAAVACGAFHSMALSRGGEVLAWGTNDYGQVRGRPGASAPGARRRAPGMGRHLHLTPALADLTPSRPH
jgi:alpha-tubulin suppressor-like RCC1 family protein